MRWVIAALLIGVGFPLITLALIGDAKGVAVAGVIIAGVGKLAEQVSKTHGKCNLALSPKMGFYSSVKVSLRSAS